MHISGQTHQLDRNMETRKFKCPQCSQAIDSIRSMQKHCKDHVANSGAKRVTSRYHPYANTTSDITDHTSNTNETSKVNDTLDMMDVEGIFSL
jgi:hypothetical protein